MNVYDFDKTIYGGDSSVDFYFHCLRMRPRIITFVPRQAAGLVRYAAEIISTTRAKEIFFSFLALVADTEELVDSFWRKRSSRIMEWYLQQKQGNDVVVSASPDFLLRPICAQLGIEPPVATKMNPGDGSIRGLNCKGWEKALRFKERFPRASIEQFYSDSLSDAPLAALADQAYLVKGHVVRPWPEHER